MQIDISRLGTASEVHEIYEYSNNNSDIQRRNQNLIITWKNNFVSNGSTLNPDHKMDGGGLLGVYIECPDIEIL